MELLQKTYVSAGGEQPKPAGTPPQVVKSIKIIDFAKQPLRLHLWRLADDKWYYAVSKAAEAAEFAEGNGPYTSESEATLSALAEWEATIGWSEPLS